jgi:hypothetical protein
MSPVYICGMYVACLGIIETQQVNLYVRKQILSIDPMQGLLADSQGELIQRGLHL